MLTRVSVRYAPRRMLDETDPPTPEPATRGDVERYGLMAAVTVLIVLFLIVDEQRATAPTAAPADPDSVVVLELGGRDVSASGTARLRPLQAERQADPGRDVEPTTPAPTPPPPVPAPPPEPQTPRTVVVQPGDSLSRISERELDTVRRMGEILELNGLRDANSIQAGQVLRLPPR